MVSNDQVLDEKARAAVTLAARTVLFDRCTILQLPSSFGLEETEVAELATYKEGESPEKMHRFGISVRNRFSSLVRTFKKCIPIPLVC